MRTLTLHSVAAQAVQWLNRVIATLLPGAKVPSSATAGAPDPDRDLYPDAWAQGRRMTKAEDRAMHKTPPSFVDYLAWRDWDPKSGNFILADWKSAGIMWELTPAATEGRDDATISALHDAFSKAIQTGLIEDSDSPWIAQFFVQREPTLYPFWQRCINYIKPEIRATAFTKYWLGQLDEHLQQVASPGGIFAVKKKPWRGQEERVFVTLYRNATPRGNLADSFRRCVEASNQFTSAMESHGVSLRQCRGKDLVEWMQPFFNPNPEMTQGDPYAYMRMAGFPNEVDGKVPPDWDLGATCVRSAPTQVKDGVWSFQGQLYTTLTVLEWPNPLGFGHLTGEDKDAHTLMDALPEGTRVSMSVVAEPQYLIERHLLAQSASAVGGTPQSALTNEEVRDANVGMARGEKLYRIAVVFYITGRTEAELNSKADSCAALLTKNSLPTYAKKFDLFRSTAFLDNLPFCYNHVRDQQGPQRATLQYTSEIAKLIPIAGRSTGTGSPCLKFFNRGASPMSLDPIKDKLRNAHMTIFGPTGAGKSATLNSAMLETMAVHRPYLWIVDPKWPAPSFGLLLQEFEANGLTVNHVRLSNNTDIALNPFDSALLLLEEDFNGKAISDDDEVEGGRDLLGEMLYLTIAMITGSEEEELKKMRRADRTIICEAIYAAAKTVKERNGTTVLTEDVADALSAAAKAPDLESTDRSRCYEMAKSLRYFTVGTPGQIFNRAGKPWPDRDVTLVEFANLGTEGSQDQLAVAFMSLLQAIQTHITRRQRDHRDTVVVVDEVHTLAKNPMMGSYIAKIIKTWRSAGAWYWQGTQSIADFHGPMKPLLTQLEWMLCLSMPKDEVKQLCELKSLTAEQATMVESATKAPGLYVEGVVLHETCTALFRAVLPAQALALAQTEKTERAARTDIQKQLGCTELEATREVARRIRVARASYANAKPVQTFQDRL